MKTVIMITIIVLAGSSGDLLLSRGMRKIDQLESFNLKQLINLIRQVFTSYHVISGIACMAVAFFSLLSVLSWAPLSLVEPATAISYVVNTLGAKLYLKEKIDRTRWIGTILVSMGAFLLLLEI